MMTVGSLFSGIGGFDLGLERAGMQIEWQVENNDYCREVLKKHWPHVPCHYDITTIDWGFIPRVDLVCGGFPCQPFSVAGKRRAADDDRYLWPEVVRCLAVLRPTWFLGENVYGLLHLGIEQMYADLEALGYQVAILGIPACAVGSPQIRHRVWIIAHLASQQVGSPGQSREHGCVAVLPAANAESVRRQQRDTDARGNSKREIAKKKRTRSPNDYRWPSPPGFCRMDVRVPDWSHRIKAIGNSIVPQIAEALGRMIVAIETRARAG